MAGNFSLKKFSDIDLNDPFFDSLKEDYPVGGKVKPFEVWFPEKAQERPYSLGIRRREWARCLCVYKR